MSRCITRRGLAAASAGLALAGRSARAQTASWPSRPVRIIVAYAAGGSTDITARLVAAKLSERLGGASVVVENRPGGGTLVGTEAAARATPDGYTLLFATGAMIATPLLSRGAATIDARRDFAPIAIVQASPLLFVANRDAPFRGIGDVLAAARARPGTLNISHPGAGSSNHLALELFKRMANVDVTLVPYTGNAPSLNALVRGDVPVALDSIISSRALMDGGQIRALAVTGARRSAALPDVPTVAESGVPGFNVTFWSGLAAPRATPVPILDRLNQEVNAIVRMPDVIERLKTLGSEPVGGSREDFTRLIEEEHERLSVLIREANIRPD